MEIKLLVQFSYKSTANRKNKGKWGKRESRWGEEQEEGEDEEGKEKEDGEKKGRGRIMKESERGLIKGRERYVNK